MIPKVSARATCTSSRRCSTRSRRRSGCAARIGISVLIETAIGMVNIDEIATACPARMEAMVFGVADYAASLQSHTTSIGGGNPHYAMLTDPNGTPERERHWGDQWHYALSRIAVTCRAHGLRPIDGRSATSTIPRAISPPPAAPPCWATRASGRSTPRRSRWPTRSSRPTRTSSKDPPHHRGDARRRRERQRRRLARRPADRRRLDPDGGTLLAKLEQIEAKENGALRPRGGGAAGSSRSAGSRATASSRPSRTSEAPQVTLS